MVPDPQAAPAKSADGTERQGWGRLLGGRTRKWVLGLGAAFLAGIGLAISNWAKDRGEETANKVIVGLSGGPLNVRVVPDGEFVSGHVFAPYYVIPRERVESPRAAGNTQLARITDQGAVLDGAWSEQHGGIPGSPQIVRLELSGKGDKKVTITSVRPHVLSSGPPVKGWYVANPGCGAQPVRIAELNLDAPGPVKGFFDDTGRERHLALSVTRDDREQLELHASTRRAAVTWKAEVFYSSPDGSGSVTIPEGEPFKVTSETASNGYRTNFAGSRPSVSREPGWDKGITAC